MSHAYDNLHGIAQRALELVPDGGIVGLGSGRTATEFIKALGERVRAGLRVRGIPTSQASADLAVQLGIPLTTFEEVDAIDVDVDGADEVDPQCNLIKGLGGAMVREKIVASAAKKFVIVVGAEKLVPKLGSHGTLPVEVVPFGLSVCQRRLKELGFIPQLRTHDSKTYITDNGNYVLNCRIPVLDDPAQVEQTLREIPGVVGTGLFLNMADIVLIQRGDAVEVRTREVLKTQVR